MTEYNDWKIWNGGECPVPEGTMGQTQSAGLTRVEAEGDGSPHHIYGIFGWHYEWYSTDIIAYRTVKEPVAEVDRTKTTFKRGDYTLEWTSVNGKVTKVELAK